jgi:hypothetical protein
VNQTLAYRLSINRIAWWVQLPLCRHRCSGVKGCGVLRELPQDCESHVRLSAWRLRCPFEYEARCDL